ncbi:RICIN domain-containing protein [Streptomyces sp. NPDC012769]|uniref:RICIN domain-containing protein n=1 Tax=Streptomyces sp. NPDC012769 TaxID=3364848 RepID=UPI0036D0FC6F
MTSALITAGAVPALASDGVTTAANQCEQRNTYRNAYTGTYLDAKGAGGKGTKVITWHWNGRANQYWCMEKAPEGGWYIHPSYNLGLCLDSPVDNSAPILWNCKHNANQRFNVSNGKIQLRRDGLYVEASRTGEQTWMGYGYTNRAHWS